MQGNQEKRGTLIKNSRKRELQIKRRESNLNFRKWYKKKRVKEMVQTIICGAVRVRV